MRHETKHRGAILGSGAHRVLRSVFILVGSTLLMTLFARQTLANATNTSGLSFSASEMHGIAHFAFFTMLLNTSTST